MEAVAFSSGKQGRVQVFDSREGLTRNTRATLFGVKNTNANDFDACTINSMPRTLTTTSTRGEYNTCGLEDE